MAIGTRLQTELQSMSTAVQGRIQQLQQDMVECERYLKKAKERDKLMAAAAATTTVSASGAAPTPQTIKLDFKKLDRALCLI
jgi:hypothetical protein